jgi:hypothetical protein
MMAFAFNAKEVKIEEEVFQLLDGIVEKYPVIQTWNSIDIAWHIKGNSLYVLDYFYNDIGELEFLPLNRITQMVDNWKYNWRKYESTCK